MNRSLLLVLLSLIPFRAVAGETRTFEVLGFLRNLQAPEGPSPATTLAVFTIVLAVATIMLCARLWRDGPLPYGRGSVPESGPGFRRTGAEIGLVLLLIAAAISTWRAGQKHLALTGVLDFLGLGLYLLLLRQLLTRTWHIRLAMTVVLATGAMLVAKCVYQRLYEIPETIKYYEEHKAELDQDDAGGGDDPRRSGLQYDYEQRLRGGSVSGYFQHPNVVGSYLILIILSALAVARSRFRRRPRWTLVAPLLLAGGGAVALSWSQSKGAAAACALALLVWAAGGLATRRRGREEGPRTAERETMIAHAALHRSSVRGLWVGNGRFVATLWVSILIGAVAVIGLLHFRPEALGRSMLYRSLYWQGAWAMMLDQGPLGVGADNFGRFFTRYKAVECPEEVDDPHSWVVKVAAEWGVLGLVGLIALLVGVSRRLARGPESPVAVAAGPGGSIILWLGCIAVVFFGWWMVLLWGSHPGYMAMVFYVAALPWVIGFAAVALEHAGDAVFADDEIGPMSAGILAGLIGFLLHAGIDLALFRSGAATTFFALMAVGLALRDGYRAEVLGAGRARRAAAVAVGVIGAALVAVVLVLLVLPATRLARALQVARTGERPASWDDYLASASGRVYLDAMDAYPLDGAAVNEMIGELSARVETADHVRAVFRLVPRLHERDPANPVVEHHLAALFYRRFTLTGDLADLDKAIGAMRQAVAAYPTSPVKRLVFADLLEAGANATASPRARCAAADELQQALDLDARRIYISKPHRFTEEQRTQIKERIKRLRG